MCRTCMIFITIETKIIEKGMRKEKVVVAIGLEAEELKELIDLVNSSMRNKSIDLVMSREEEIGIGKISYTMLTRPVSLPVVVL